MDSPKEFLRFAQQCLRWAELARDERQREVMLEMARLWMRAALEAERTIAVLDCEAPLVPKKEES